MDKRGSELALEEGVQILPTEREDLAASEEAERRTTPTGDAERRSVGADGGVARDSLVGTSRDMGHVREDEGEVLVARDVHGRTSFRDEMRKL